jgi:WD40 repeat protein
MNQPTPDRISQAQENLIKDTHVEGSLVFAPTQIGTKIGKQVIIQQISRTEVTQQPLIKDSPYQGLRRFNVKDHDRFFGRDSLIADLITKVKQSGLTFVLGASGSGKSSVVRAGLIPALKKRLVNQKFYDFILTPNQDPFASLYRCLLSEEKDYRFKESEARLALQAQKCTLSEIIKSLKKDKECWLFFIDQFEELFTICDDLDKRKNFIEGLVQVFKLSSRSVRIVLAMRSDFLEQFSFYTELGNIASQNNILLVTEMFRDELRQAIEAPAAKHGVVFEDGLVKQIIDEVEGQKGYLPLLQYTLNLLWETECKTFSDDGRCHIDDRTLNRESYAKLKGVRGALQERVNEIYDNLEPGEQAIAKQIFLQVVNILEIGSGTKAVSRRANRDNFVGKSVEKTLTKLIDENLLVSSSAYSNQAQGSSSKLLKQTATVEIAHEILISSWDKLRGWLEEEKEAIILKHWLAAETNRWQAIRAQDESKAQNELLKGSRLEQVVDFRKRDAFRNIGGLRPEENQFIDVSIADVERIEQDKEAQRKRELQQAQELARSSQEIAKQNKAIAEQSERLAKQSRKFAIGALAALGVISIILVATFFQWQEAQRRSILASAESARANLLANRSMEGTIAAVKAVRLLDNPFLGDREALYREVSDALIWANSETKERLRLQGIAELEFSPNNKFIITTNRNDPDGIATIRSIPGETLTEVEIVGVGSIEFSPDSKLLITNARPIDSSHIGDPEKTSELWTTSGQLIKKFLAKDFIWFSPDSKLLVSRSQENGLQLWDTKGQLVKNLSGTGQNTTMEFSPDSKILATSDTTTTLWNSSGEALIQIAGEFKQFVEYAVESGGKKLILVTQDSSITKLWDANGFLIIEIPGEFKQLAEYAAKSGGKKLILVTQDGNITKLWNADNSTITAIPGKFDDVDAEKNIVVTTQADGSVTLWNTLGQSISASISGTFYGFAGTTLLTFDEKFAENKTAFHLWNISNQSLQSIPYTSDPWFESLSPDGQYLLTGGLESNDTQYSVKLWAIDKTPTTQQFAITRPFQEDAADHVIPFFHRDGKSIILNPAGATSNFPAIVDFSGTPLLETQPDDLTSMLIGSKHLATLGEDRAVNLWNSSGNLITQFKNSQDGPPLDEVFSPDDQFFATITPRGTMQLWDLSGNWKTLVPKHQFSSAARPRIEFSPNGQFLAHYTQNPGSISLWHISGDPIAQIPIQPDKYISFVGFSSDNQVLAVNSENSLRLWDLSSRSFTDFQDASGSYFKFSPDGKQIVTADEGTIKIWDIPSNQLIESFKVSPDTSLMGLNKNSEIIMHDYSDEKNASIQTWSTSGKLVRSFNANETDYAVLSPDRNLIAGDVTTETDEVFVQLWDSSGKVIAEKLQGGFEEFSPNGEMLATIDQDKGIVYLWRSDGTPILELPGYQSLSSVWFSADSQLVVVGHGDNARSVLDTSGRLIVNLPAMQSGILNVRFSPADSKLLATLGNDGTIKLLRLDDRQTLLKTACNQISAYLQSPASELSESDRRLCDGFVTSP